MDNQDNAATDLGGDATDGTDPDAGGGAGDQPADSADSATDSSEPYPPPVDEADSGEGDSYPPPGDGDADTDTGEGDADSDGGDADAGSGDADADSGDGDADAGDADAGDGDADAGDDADADTGEGDADAGDADADSGDADADTGDGDADTGDADADSSESDGDTSGESGDGTPDSGDSQTGDSATDDSSSGTIPQTHTVARGENLYRIGLKYGISWVTLAQINDLPNPNRIHVGQALKLSADSEDSGTGDQTPPGQDVQYLVKAGDTLFLIGKAFDVDWREIAKKNNAINPNHIVVGQTLIIPGVQSSTETPETERIHTVQRGQTLFRISLQYGVPWTKIAEENGITSPYVIFAGQALVIPAN